jgi:hypothetical protein
MGLRGPVLSFLAQLGTEFRVFLDRPVLIDPADDAVLDQLQVSAAQPRDFLLERVSAGDAGVRACAFAEQFGDKADDDLALPICARRYATIVGATVFLKRCLPVKSR